MGKTVQCDTSTAFIGFVRQILHDRPPGQEVHLFVESLSLRNSKAVSALLAGNPRLKPTFTPTYNSWRNQVAPWLPHIE